MANRTRHLEAYQAVTTHRPHQAKVYGEIAKRLYLNKDLMAAPFINCIDKRQSVIAEQ
ncbi:hypothetical protein [Vibrio toranzoniae]|uniref:hypothetical protein n=1 Tax=Vibrio toranzoniae TaxID=1194427 RepID=UPI001378EFAD|nr:hypothetical protein [Vibrio toranzoniae]NAZ94267.1 hypothetical protein [Vibrio toranzoniae]